MARGDFVLFEEFSKDVASGVHNFSSCTLKLGIVNNDHVPSADEATPRWADYSANEVSTAGGYTANGITLSGDTFAEAGGVTTVDDTGNVLIAQNAAGFENGYWGILYNDTASNDEAIGYIDLGGPVSEVAGPIAITWSANGIFTVTTVAPA